MKACYGTCVAALWLFACSSELRESTDQQAYMQGQGTQLQGIQLQGIQAQGMTMLGFQLDRATLNGAALTNLRVERGELVAERNQATLHGDDLVGAYLYAQVRNTR